MIRTTISYTMCHLMRHRAFDETHSTPLHHDIQLHRLVCVDNHRVVIINNH